MSAGNQFEQLYSLDQSCIQDNGKFENFHFIKPGDEVEANFTGQSIGLGSSGEERYRLRLIGETDLYYKWRTEPGFAALYRNIDDALCNEATHHKHFSLKFQSNGENYVRRMYYKVVQPNNMNSVQDWRFGIWVKRENIEILEGGSLAFVAEIYYMNKDRHPASIAGTPDEVHVIDIDDGSFDWEEKFLKLHFKAEAGCVLFYVTGENFTGTVWFEDPYIRNGKAANLLPDLAPSNAFDKEYNWLGLNLSRKEWPEFDITLNDVRIFQGELFQRPYVWPENELDVPFHAINEGMNKLTIKLTSQYHEALPYKLRNIEFIKIPAHEIEIISCPSVVSAYEEFSLLISTKSAREVIFIACTDSSITALESKIILDQPGLHVIRLKAAQSGPGAEIEVKTAHYRQTAVVERVIDKPWDDVLTGTSDTVYINQNLSDMEHFLSWYMHHQVGNEITFRPAYRWSGTRILAPEVWERLVGILNRLGLHYSLMIDGRELPGSMANPTAELMDGQYYMGAQSHEQDGANNYWGPRPIAPGDELFFDIWSRSRDSVGIYPIRTPIRTDRGAFCFLDPYSASDMQQAAQNFIGGINLITKHATRHTGPSTLFRYLYQAGVEWLGAELMYGPQELVLSALRGASIAYGRDTYGAHLAVQWSSLPHDNPQRMRRYFLALYVCYMQGVNHINTEEGLWRIENSYSDHERFGKACTDHKEIQQRFYRFVQTHSRRGQFHTPMAIMHGQYDGWQCFGRAQLWSQRGDEWQFSYPEESWDLLKIFYPLSELNFLSLGPENQDRSNGFYTGTPYGALDILPVEADKETLLRYKIAAFLGWNTAEPDQIIKLTEFVKAGGTLLLGWPHLFTCTKRADSMGNNPQVLGNDLIRELIGVDLDGFVETRINNRIVQAGNVQFKGAVIAAVSDDGIPIVLENSLGKGKVILVNSKSYPAEDCVKDLYSGLLTQLGQQMLDLERSRGWLNSSNDIGFTVYDHNGLHSLRTIYFLNVNWWADEEKPSETKLLWGEQSIQLDVIRGNMNMITLADNWGIWTRDNETDIIEIDENKTGVIIKLQGQGKTILTLLNKQLSTSKNLLFVKCDGQDVEAVPIEDSTSGWEILVNLHGPAVLDVQLVEH